MKKNKKVVAIVITFNRKKKLSENIESLLLQTKKLDKIIVFDNASSDGTDKFIKEKYKNNSNIIYIKNKINVGGAGGFHYAAKYAMELGYDWIWFMDDDIVFKENALEKYLEYSNEYELIQAKKSEINNKKIKKIRRFNVKLGFYYPSFLFNKNKDIKLNTVSFEGILVKSDVINKIGLPNKDFFITYDDVCFGLLAHLNGFKIIEINDYLIQKTLPISKKVRKFRIFYKTRNIFLLEKIINEETDFEVNYLFSSFLRFIYSFFKIIFLSKHSDKADLLSNLFYGYKSGLKIKFQEKKEIL